jgi:hypothetical protein
MQIFFWKIVAILAYYLWVCSNAKISAQNRFWEIGERQCKE